MEYRFRQTAAIARALTKNMGEQLCAALDTSGYDGCHGVAVAYNPTQTHCQGVNIVKVLLPQLDLNRLEFLDREGQPIPAQLLSTEPVMEHRYPLKTLIQFEPKTVAVYAIAPGYPRQRIPDLWIPRAPKRLPRPGRIHGRLGESLPSGRKYAHRSADLSDTGKLAVTFAHDGTLSVTDHAAGKQYAGLLRLEDGGDNGDGYNYVRPMADQVLLQSR